MQANQPRQVGNTALYVTQLGLGGTALGNIYSAVEEQAALDTIDAAYQAGVRYFDTAPLYGYGLSEIRLGKGLARYPRDQVVISTKVGWALVPFEPGQRQAIDLFDKALPFRGVMDYSGDAILRSIEESLKRLTTDRIDIVLMHDPDEAVSVQPGRDSYEVSHFDQALKEAYPILDDLRRQGVVKAIGLGMNQWQMLCDFAQAGDFECFLLAGRYTLLEQEPIHTFLPLCQQKNISVIIGGPYNSGILATGAVEGAYYNYRPATPEVLARVRQIEAVCARHNVTLQAAALQFPFGALGFSRFSSTGSHLGCK
jgi:D-threo-aldose 1-dehydrogenase